MAIIREERRIDNLYIIDTGQFNLPSLTSVFCWFDGERALLMDGASHLRGAATTFGRFVGTMEPPPEEAFLLIEPDSFLPVEFSDGSRIKLLHTPGHTPDHCSPAVMKEGRCIFCFAAEACGTMYTDRVILTTPSSMPPNFCFTDYMTSFEKIRAIRPEMLGLCHFGVITGDDIVTLFDDHLAFMINLRNGIAGAFKENQSTSHVMKATEHLWENRIDSGFHEMEGSDLFFGNLRLALTYGIMVDLGLRESKYEERFPLN